MRWAIIRPMREAPTSAVIARVIRAARERAGLPIARVARASGIKERELEAIEAGHARPSIAALDRIARALGSSLVQLLRSRDLASRGGLEVRAATSRSREKLGLPEIGRAIAELPVKRGSKIDAAASAAILYAMKACNENQSAAARLLAMERKAFVRRLIRARRRSRG
jgi:transcriptional regulator with XRE-family HTH domain